jgi:hypothetical protein
MIVGRIVYAGSKLALSHQWKNTALWELCGVEGPVGVEVFAGNTQDANTVLRYRRRRRCRRCHPDSCQTDAGHHRHLGCARPRCGHLNLGPLASDASRLSYPVTN